MILGLCGWMLLCASATAQLGSAFTYQGRLDDNGVPKNGTVDLRFDAFNVVTAGTALNAAPLILDAVPVSNGVFTVKVDFGVGIFIGDAIFLQIGVREDPAGVGTDPNGFTTLTPRQSVTPAPYALHADNVAFDAISGQQILDGSINAADVDTTSTAVGLQRRLTGVCAAGQALSNIGSSGSPTCVSVGDITEVLTATGSGLNGGAASGSVALSIDPSETQQRVSGICQRNRSVMYRVNLNGSVDCTYIDTPAPVAAVVLDSAGDVGSHLSVLPNFNTTLSVAYYDTSNGGRLKFVSCADGNCGTVNPPVFLDDPANNVGKFPSAKVVSANMAVAYYDDTADDLKLALCSPSTCTGTITTRILDSSGDVGRHAAIMQVGFLVAVAYYDASNNTYKYVRCNDPACSAPVARTLTGLGGGGLANSAVTSVRDQNLSLPEFTVLSGGSAVVLVRCADEDCRSFATTVINSGDVGPPLSMLRATVSGTVQRWFSYARPIEGTLAFRTCGGDACSGVSFLGGPGLSNPFASAMMLRRDTRNPIYFQTRSTTPTLIQTLAFADSVDTGFANTLTGSATAQGALDVYDNNGPIVVYYETTLQDLKFLRCTRDDCSDL